MPDEFRAVELHIAKLQLAPGDVLVVKVDALLSTERANFIRDHIRQIVGPDVAIMILERGIEVSVLTKAEIDARVG